MINDTEYCYYTTAENEAGESGASNIVCATPESGSIYGCTDMDACNYDSDANMDDGSCLENDCAGECGGNAVEDNCGICDADPTNDCEQEC